MALRKFVFMNQVEGFSEEQAPTDELLLGLLTLSGVGGVAINAGGQLISNVITPVAASDAATKGYVDAVAIGLDVKQSVRLGTDAALAAYTPAGSGVGKTLTANANGALTVDGVAAVVNNRILVMSEAGVGKVDHGIYTVTVVGSGGAPWVLTRATDFDTDVEVTAGAFTFVTEGTANADRGYLLTTNDPIIVDTTQLDFRLFTSQTTYTFEQGLNDAAGVITVELDTGANAQGVGAAGGSSGLEFDANTAAGKLRAAVNATGGLSRTATGLGVLNDPQANTAGNNPSLSSSATGELTLRAPKVEDNYIGAEAIAVGDPVAWGTVNNKLVKGRADTDAKARIVGVARTLCSANNDTFGVVTGGVCTGALTGATAGDPQYLLDTGGIGAFASITASKRVIRVGFAKNATDLFVQIMDLGKKAA